MVINPHYKAAWRPTVMLSQRYDIDLSLLAKNEAFQPKSIAEAIGYIASLGLQEITDYDGHACQQAMILDKAYDLLGSVLSESVVVEDLPVATATVTALPTIYRATIHAI